MDTAVPSNEVLTYYISMWHCNGNLVAEVTIKSVVILVHLEADYFIIFVSTGPREVGFASPVFLTSHLPGDPHGMFHCMLAVQRNTYCEIN